MKNLNKKIGVIALSGLVLAGSGIIGGKSVAHAELASKAVKEKAISELRESKYEEKRWPLRLIGAKKEDRDKIEEMGYSRFNYRVFEVDPSKERLDYLADPVEGKPHLAKIAKQFKNVDDFISYMEEFGEKDLKGFYSMNIRGGIYIIEFGVERKLK